MLVNHQVFDIYASCWTTVYERSLCFYFILKRNKHKMKYIIQIKKFFDEWRTEWLDFRCCPTMICLPHAVSSKIFFVFKYLDKCPVIFLLCCGFSVTLSGFTGFFLFISHSSIEVASVRYFFLVFWLLRQKYSVHFICISLRLTYLRSPSRLTGHDDSMPLRSSPIFVLLPYLLSRLACRGKDRNSLKGWNSVIA